MALLKRETRPAPLDVFDRFFPEWPGFFRRPTFFWPEVIEDVIRVEEFTEDGTLVVRADLPGLDPDKDVEITVTEGMLHIEAQRREEEKTEGKDYVRRELHYGGFSRVLPLPTGATEADISASYKDGTLEIRVPLAKAETGATKIPITKA